MSNCYNIAYTPKYQSLRKQKQSIFIQENLRDTVSIPLADGYTAVRKSYYRSNPKSGFGANETLMFNLSGTEVYHWRNIDDDGEFVTKISHCNGHDYLLFRVDLYGYGTYDLTARQEFFYVPEGPESFIWTEAHYSPHSSVLAVGGCFWACPSSVHLVDFRNPMKESRWIDLVEMLDGGYDRYEDIDFVRWDGGTLIVSAQKLVETNGKFTTVPEELAIPQEEYMSWF